MYGFFFLSTFATGAALAKCGTTEYYTRIWVLIVAVCCTFYGLASINVYLFAVFDGVTDFVDFIPWGFVNIRYWSHIATWCLPLMPLAILAGPLKDNRLWRFFIVLGAGLWWWILLFTAARGSVLAIIFGAILVVCMFGRLSFPWVKISLKLFFVGFSFWLVLSFAIPTYMAEEAQFTAVKASSSGRLVLFSEAWAMSLQHFPFGMGPQSWLTHEILTNAYASSKKFGHPHNMYLMWAAEYGWVLVAIAGVVVVQAVRFFLKERKRVINERLVDRLLFLAGFTASVSAALFHAGVSAVFIAPGSMLVGLFVLIGFWALIVPAARYSKLNYNLAPSFKRRLLVGFFVNSIIIVTWLGLILEVSAYYKDMRHDEILLYEKESTMPRFWFHGNYPRSAAPR